MFRSKMVRNTVQLTIALLAVAVVGCNAPSATGPEVPASVRTLPSTPAADLSLQGLLKQVVCVLPDTIGIDIGPAGGSITLGGNTLTIPAHSLTQLTHIIMLPALGNGAAVQFLPEGLQFAANARPTLTLNTDCIGNPANDYIVYTDDFGNVKEIEQTTGRTAHSVSATIGHFSRYAVAW